MTDKEKLEAIRAEIHRLVDVRGYDEEMANDLFTFMDSLPNEPVSEDLEKAAYEYANVENPTCTCYECLIKTFKAGAQWQASHSLETIKGMEEQAFLAGVEAEQINQNYGKDLLYVCNQTHERTKKEFIDKSDIVAEIERLKTIQLSIFSKGETKESCYDSLTCISVYNGLLSFLDTLEVKEMKESSAADRGMAEEVIVNLKRIEQDYHIDLTKEMEWVRSKVQKGE